MATEFTSDGPVIETQPEIEAALAADQRAEISATLDVSTSSPHGQHNDIVARSLRRVGEAAQAVWAMLDPESVIGRAQDVLYALQGVFRKPATATRTIATVNVDPGTYAAGALIAQVTGQPGRLFANVDAVTNGGGAAADVGGVLFDCTETGPLSCPVDTLAIGSPVSGWNSVTTNTEGVLGRTVESNADFRTRWRASTNPYGPSGSIIAQAVLALSGVTSCVVVQNRTDATVDAIPSRAYEVVVFGPASPSAADNTAVATAILGAGPAGMRTYGTSSVTLYDSEGQEIEIFFTRPTAEFPIIAITCDVDSTYAGDDAVKAQIVARAAETFRAGLDAHSSLFVAWTMGVQGVLRCAATVDGVATRAIGSREYASIVLGNVSVTSTEATP